MLDARVYRAGFLPAVLALVIAAFSLQDPPRGLTTTLPPDAFNGRLAFASLQDLASAFPHRKPGSQGDQALAARVGGALRQDGFEVRTRRFTAPTAVGDRELEDVIGIHAGQSSGEIVAVAHRDALHSPARAELSGTAALLELARVVAGRTSRKTLVLVSTSGGSGGAAGAAQYAEHAQGVAGGAPGPVNGAIVLGDLAGTRVHRPVVVPWSDGMQVAPIRLRRTVADAVRLETGRRPGELGSAAQFARLAFPMTFGEQGELGRHGLPAVLVSVSGERGPGNGTPVSRDQLQQFGRAVLRSVSAIDAGSARAELPRAELLIHGKVVPGWAVRLLVAALMLPALMAAVDGFARVRRRRQPVGRWMAWIAAGALPPALAAGAAELLTLAGALPASPPAPVPPGAIPLDAGRAAALAGVAAVLVGGWVVLRPAATRLAGAGGDAAAPGAAAALGLVTGVLVVAVWVSNPFAAALLLPALHFWLLVSLPEVPMRRPVALMVVGITLAPAAMVVVYFAVRLGLGPLQLPWTVLLLVTGGHVGVLSVFAWCVLLGCLGSVLAIVRAQAAVPVPAPPSPTTRGPVGYAGPGSLGGTESALRH